MNNIKDSISASRLTEASGATTLSRSVDAVSGLVGEIDSLLCLINGGPYQASADSDKSEQRYTSLSAAIQLIESDVDSLCKEGYEAIMKIRNALRV